MKDSKSFWENKRVLITGGHGFIGQAVVNEIKKFKTKKIIIPTKKQFNLTKQSDVNYLFKTSKPDIVLHLAGQVGGIGANRKAKGEFYYNNMIMGTIMMENARIFKVKKFLALAAGCGYSNKTKNPLRESNFWNGLPDETSIGYSMAKKMIVIQSWTYRDQYKFNSSILIPTNSYGPNDNFDLNTCHVVPALIKKFIDAKEKNKKSVTLWGTGKPTRDFLFVEDTAKAILKVTQNYNESGPINLGTGVETSIHKLALLIKDLTNFQGNIKWDKSKPDGQMKKYYDMSLFKSKIGYIPNISLRNGLKKTIDWYKKNKI